MSTLKSQERFISVHKNELIDALCTDNELTGEEREDFRRLCRLITAIAHFDYNQHLERLRTSYAPFDPEGETSLIHRLNAEQKQQHLNNLFTEVASLLERAEYTHLSGQDLEPTLRRSSHWGIKMHVDFRAFERLAIFVRGDSVQRRWLRRVRRGMLAQECEVPIYKRVVMLMKFRPHRHLDRMLDAGSVFFQLFKDIPKLDLNMLLPGARIRLRFLDRCKIALPILTGLGLAAWQIFVDVADYMNRFSAVFNDNPVAVWGAASGTLGYGVRSYYNYQQTRQRYNLELTRVLFFQNLDTNLGVLFRLLNEAEEQECREAILAYYFLWRHAGEQGWSSRDLDHYIEHDLEQRAHLAVDFDNADFMFRLEKLRIVEKVGERYRAQPMAIALKSLEEKWGHFITNNRSHAAPTMADAVTR